MTYRYMERDLLAGAPFHYMFCAFEGTGFLQAYIEARRTACASLDGALPKPERATISIVMPGAVVAPIETEPLLQAMTYEVNGGVIDRDCAIAAWTDLLARKFEVGKRLRSRYGADLRPLGSITVGRKAYAQLAYLVALLIRGPEELRLLNTLLKLNDVVLSGGPVAAEWCGFVKFAVNRELECIDVISLRLGVNGLTESLDAG